MLHTDETHVEGTSRSPLASATSDEAANAVQEPAVISGQAGTCPQPPPGAIDPRDLPDALRAALSDPTIGPPSPRGA